MSQIVKTIGRNTLYGYLMMGWTILLGFWITPRILHLLGNELYGIWGISLSTFGFATFLDLGLGSALVVSVADRQVRENPEEMNKAIHSAMTLYTLMGVVGGMVLIGGGQWLVRHFLKISPEFQGLAASILSVYGFLFMIQMPAKVYDDVLIGIQRLDVTNKIGICVRTTERLLVLLLLAAKFPFLLVVWVSGGVGVALYIFEFLMVKRLIPYHTLRFALRKKDAKELFTRGTQQFIAGFGFVFLGVIDKFLLGALIHVQTVTFYELASRPSQMLHQLSLRFFHPVYPASAELGARHETERLKVLFKKGIKILFVLLAPLAAAIFLWSGEIIRFWVGTGYELSGQILRVLTVGYFVLSFDIIPSAMMFGLNKAWIISYESLIRILLNIALSFLLIRRMGALGAAYGLTLASLITTTFFFFIIAKQIGIEMGEIVREVLLFPLLLCIGVWLLLREGSSFPLAKGPCFVLFMIFFFWISFIFYIGKKESLSMLKAVFGRTPIVS